MIRAREGAFAEATLERPVPRVLPEVPGEFIGAGELPSAALPGAHVRLLSGVGPVMRLEVRALGVGLEAAGEGAAVRRHFLLFPPFSPPPALAPQRRLDVRAEGRGVLPLGAEKRRRGEQTRDDVAGVGRVVTIHPLRPALVLRVAPVQAAIFVLGAD